MMSDSQVASQWNNHESQFMRLTGNVVSRRYFPHIARAALLALCSPNWDRVVTKPSIRRAEI